jgi:hypothetical protein
MTTLTARHRATLLVRRPPGSAEVGSAAPGQARLFGSVRFCSTRARAGRSTVNPFPARIVSRLSLDLTEPFTISPYGLV